MRTIDIVAIAEEQANKRRASAEKIAQMQSIGRQNAANSGAIALQNNNARLSSMVGNGMSDSQLADLSVNAGNAYSTYSDGTANPDSKMDWMSKNMPFAYRQLQGSAPSASVSAGNDNFGRAKVGGPNYDPNYNPNDPLHRQLSPDRLAQYLGVPKVVAGEGNGVGGGSPSVDPTVSKKRPGLLGSFLNLIPDRFK